MKRLFWILFPFIINAANYSDNFNRSDSIGANWTTIPTVNPLHIVGDTAVEYTVLSARNGSYYNVAPSSDSQSVSSHICAGYYTFIACAIQDGANLNCYTFGYEDLQSDIVLGKYINGVFNNLSATDQMVSYGSLFTIVHRNDTLIGLIDGTPIDTVIDSDFGSGYAGLIGYASPGGYGIWTDFELDNKEDISGCDSVYQIGFTDSVVTQLIYKSTVGCAETDSIRVVYGTDTTELDTAYHAGSYSAGDTIKDTLKGLSPSTKYFAASLDSLFKTLYDTAWTLDSSEGIPVYFCATPDLDSLSDSSVASGTNIRVYGSELKDNNGHFYLDGSEQTIVSLEKDSAEVTISGSLGTYDFYFIDSCNQYSDTIEVTIVESITPEIDSIKSLRRRDFYWSVARVGDSITIYSLNNSFDSEGDSSKVVVGSLENTAWPHYAWSADSINLIVPLGTESKYFRISVKNKYNILSTLPVNHNFYVKTPGGL
jgi:hypothetical protein